MKHLIILIAGFLIFQLSHSQINEIGVFAGGSNFIGDIGSTTYIAPHDPAFGLLYKWNRSPRHSWRASLIYANLSANDNEAEDPRRIERDYNFSINILELSAGLEFTFLDFNLHDGNLVATPYLYTGIVTTKHDNHFHANGNDSSIISKTDNVLFGIPITIGFKTNILRQLVLGIEAGARFAFSDTLDGSNKNLGNINNNDWYTFSGLTLTYTFGENACYCL